MRALLPLATLALAVACVPVASASCAGSTNTLLCVDLVEGDPDFVALTLTQSYAPVGSTYACGAAGAGGAVGLVSLDAAGFAALCLAHYGATGSTFVCASAVGIPDDPHAGCLALYHADGWLGVASVAANGSDLCVELSGLRDCVPMP